MGAWLLRGMLDRMVWSARRATLKFGCCSCCYRELVTSPCEFAETWFYHPAESVMPQSHFRDTFVAIKSTKPATACQIDTRIGCLFHCVESTCGKI